MHKYASDPRSSAELVAAHRLERASSTYEAMPILHYRGGREEFEIGRDLAESVDADDRAIGADILAQLGWGDRTFLTESVDVLIRLLGDPDPQVVYCAAVGLGHRGDARAIAPLAALADHSDVQVRYGVAYGLGGHDDDRALATLIRLSHDVDSDVRDWAMFGLGSLTEVDSPAIRDALIGGLDDADSEIRGEALLGLARRRDARTRDALLREWECGEIGILSLEAAEVLADPMLAPRLTELLATLELDDDQRFKDQLVKAIAASQP